jgi:hypothetical protein
MPLAKCPTGRKIEPTLNRRPGCQSVSRNGRTCRGSVAGVDSRGRQVAPHPNGSRSSMIPPASSRVLLICPTQMCRAPERQRDKNTDCEVVGNCHSSTHYRTPRKRVSSGFAELPQLGLGGRGCRGMGTPPGLVFCQLIACKAVSNRSRRAQRSAGMPVIATWP